MPTVGIAYPTYITMMLSYGKSRINIIRTLVRHSYLVLLEVSQIAYY